MNKANSNFQKLVIHWPLYSECVRLNGPLYWKLLLSLPSPHNDGLCLLNSHLHIEGCGADA